MKKKIKDLLAEEKIFLSTVTSLGECVIKKPHLLSRCGISSGSVILFAIPYLTSECLDEKRNISSYAVSRDYHAYASSLFERLEKVLKNEYPKNKFAFFADHSPIDERDAALKSGLGFLGKNRLVITEEYSSYFFIGEIITDATLSPDIPKGRTECDSCGRCLYSCPMNADSSSECLSAITQKKGELSPFEISLIKKYGTLWGCDICQEVCPHTKRATDSGSIFTEIEFFKQKAKAHLTSSYIEELDEKEFCSRAYSWRGKAVIMRNIRHFEES